MRKLGLSSLRDAAAALIENGRVIVEPQEERFVRVKHVTVLPVCASVISMPSRCPGDIGRSVGGGPWPLGLSGCGKTISTRENFDGPPVWHKGRTLPRESSETRGTG